MKTFKRRKDAAYNKAIYAEPKRLGQYHLKKLFKRFIDITVLSFKHGGTS